MYPVNECPNLSAKGRFCSIIAKVNAHVVKIFLTIPVDTEMLMYQWHTLRHYGIILNICSKNYIIGSFNITYQSTCI